MVIDAHAHLEAEEDYVNGLLRAADEHGIDKICLSALGPQYGMPSNDAVREAFRAHPDRIVGVGTLRPGIDQPEAIDRLADEGFRAIKFTSPAGPYDSPEFFPLYERAEARHLPALVHCTILPRHAHDKRYNVNSAWLRPIFLDAVARHFPGLTIIIPHLGVPWHEETAMLARVHPNVYVDLTGDAVGWRQHKEISWFRETLWWTGAFEKVVFGTDVHYRHFGLVLEDMNRIFEGIQLDEQTRRKVMGETMARLLGLS